MKKIIAFALTFSPIAALAAPLENINQVASRATQIGNLIIQLAIALAVVWIIVAVVRYFIAGGEEGRNKGRDAIVYGVIGLFIILSIWGLVFILTQSFSTRNAAPTQEIQKIGTLPPPPQIETGQ